MRFFGGNARLSHWSHGLASSQFVFILSVCPPASWLSLHWTARPSSWLWDTRSRLLSLPGDPWVSVPIRVRVLYTATNNSPESKQAQHTSHSPPQVEQPFETSTPPLSTPEEDPMDRQHAALVTTATSTPRFSTSMGIASRLCTAVHQTSGTMEL